MKRFLNTLFVTTQKVYLHKEGESLVARLNGEIKMRMPVINLQGIMCFGNIYVSPFLIGACVEKGIIITFLTEWGKFLWRAQGKVNGNVLLRKEQYRISDNEKRSAEMARACIGGKIYNSRVVIDRVIRDHGERINKAAVEQTSAKLKKALSDLKAAQTLETIRGIEGQCAALYFGIFNEMILSQKEEFVLYNRNRRPPVDKVNAMLSLVYTLLYHDIASALESVGLDSYVGFLHRDRPGRCSLVLDLMEEFRPFFADRLVLSLINRKEITAKDFREEGSGGIFLNDEGRKALLVAYQERKKDVIKHPYLEEEMPIGTLFYVQALLLARYIRGDIDGYPPYFWR